MGFMIMDMKERETITFHKFSLNENHKDPFDRMLIRQAIANKMVLLSKDNLIELFRNFSFWRTKGSTTTA
jgi:PIN domain nuclease of toxin-antitoxin system